MVRTDSAIGRPKAGHGASRPDSPVLHMPDRRIGRHRERVGSLPSCCVLAAPGWSVAELLMPIGWAALAGEVEQVPQRLDGADVAGVLPRVDGGVRKVPGPEGAGRLPPPGENAPQRARGARRGPRPGRPGLARRRGGATGPAPHTWRLG